MALAAAATPAVSSSVVVIDMMRACGAHTEVAHHRGDRHRLVVAGISTAISRSVKLVSVIAVRSSVYVAWRILLG
jgi:hypothetical protein